MNRRSIVIVGLLLFVLALLGLPGLIKLRVSHNRDYCREHQRQLWSSCQFYTVLAPPDLADAGPKELPALPPGAALTPEWPVAERLSWLVLVLPHIERQKLPTADLASRFDRNQSWKIPAHQQAGQLQLTVALCPGNPALAEPGKLAQSQFVGLAGLAPDGAEKPVTAPEAGAFRYSAPTLFQSFKDGLSETAMLAETNLNLGPWIQAGPATLRDLDMNQWPGIGVGRQFGGNHPGGMNLLFADGSSRFLTERISPLVLRSLVTLAGGPNELVID